MGIFEGIGIAHPSSAISSKSAISRYAATVLFGLRISIF